MSISSVSFPIREEYQTLVSLCQSIYVGMITLLFFGGGGADMPHSFGFEATDWLRGIWSSCKDFALAVSVVISDGASAVQILKGVGASTVQ